MDKKRRFSRLGMKLMGVSVLGLALAFVIFYLVDSVAMPWLLSSQRFAGFWQRRNEAAVASYQEYVTEKCFSVEQAVDDADGRMENLSAGVYVILSGMEPAETGVPSSAAVDVTGGEETVTYALTWAPTSVGTSSYAAHTLDLVVEMYQIQCADGVLYVSVTPAEVRYGGLGRVVGLLLALAGFCAVVVPYIVRLLGRIGALSRETGVLMAGDLEHTIRVKGRDELSGLGEDIERLRRSVLERIEGEREAVGANSRLITSLSHDLRTPLTKLTGYLDILIYEKYQSREEHDRFLRLASEKAAQLKALTDQMFLSAQVGAPQAGLEQPPEAVDGAALLGQLLEEQCGDLRREGFQVQPPTFSEEFTLFLRTEDMVRVFDNLFSNLRKYADPNLPIDIAAEESTETVTLRLKNRAKAAPDRSDSRGVGVPTMLELMARSGGTLEASLSEGVYVSVLTFRKYPYTE